jgi:hypothetical protein
VLGYGLGLVRVIISAATALFPAEKFQEKLDPIKELHNKYSIAVSFAVRSSLKVPVSAVGNVCSFSGKSVHFYRKIT